jgi:hypothetical protein
MIVKILDQEFELTVKESAERAKLWVEDLSHHDLVVLARKLIDGNQNHYTAYRNGYEDGYQAGRRAER